MQTATHRAFWPLDPRPEEVFIEDIAHALAHTCRYGGHSRQFYSVAEHSVHVSHLVPAQHALAALLHDAAEAYVCDIPRPLKPYLAGYAEIENRVQRAIYARFNQPLVMAPEIKAADNAILLAEYEQIMAPAPEGYEWFPGHRGPAPDVTIKFWNPWLAHKWFLERFYELTVHKEVA